MLGLLQERQRHLLNTLEQLRTQQVVERLAEAQLQAKLDKADQPGKLAERLVRLVLGLRRRTMALRHPRISLIVGAAR